MRWKPSFSYTIPDCTSQVGHQSVGGQRSQAIFSGCGIYFVIRELLSTTLYHGDYWMLTSKYGRIHGVTISNLDTVYLCIWQLACTV